MMVQDAAREALLYDCVGDRVQCNTCERRCLIPVGMLGFCATRRNIGGRLYTLVYGNISSISANPIEKKPFFHFHPGTTALTIGTWSCNFDCPWCQNFDISKSPHRVGQGQQLSPAAFVALVRKYGCQGTSVSFNEPTLLFEYALDIFDLARKEGYYNTYVTNGYMTGEALAILAARGLDAMNIDIKGGAEEVRRFCAADVEVVWRNAAWAKAHGVWVELTTLLVPGINDAEDGLRRIASRIRLELGADVPWHVTGYYPAYKFGHEAHVPPTPLGTLIRAREVGVAEGLKFVYVGNVPGHPYENTYCPSCQQTLVERCGFRVTRYDITSEKRCPNCAEEIPLVSTAVPQSGG